MFLVVYEYAKLVIFSFKTKKTPIIIHFFLCLTAICVSSVLYHLPKIASHGRDTFDNYCYFFKNYCL